MQIVLVEHRYMVRCYALNRVIARMNEEFEAARLSLTVGNPDISTAVAVKDSWLRLLRLVGEQGSRIVSALIPPADPCSVGVAKVAVRDNHVIITRFEDASWDAIEATLREALHWAARA